MTAYSVADRFKTLVTGVGRKVTVSGERSVRIECEDEHELTNAFVSVVNAGYILRVTPQYRATALMLEVTL